MHADYPFTKYSDIHFGASLCLDENEGRAASAGCAHGPDSVLLMRGHLEIMSSQAVPIGA
jgi:hypothetical protein